MPVHMSGAQGDQKGALGSLAQRLQVAVSCHVGAWEQAPPTRGAPGALNNRAISPVQVLLFTANQLCDPL